MSTRIVFNGKSYRDPSEMPAEVRRAYDQVLGLLADADGNGVPDLLEKAGLGNVISLQHSRIVVNGQTYDGPGQMPPGVRLLYEAAMGQVAGQGDLPSIPGGASDHDPTGSMPWADVTRGLEQGLVALLALIALVIVGGALFIMVQMDAGSGSRSNRLYIAIAALVILGAVDSQASRLAARRRPVSLTTSPAERRYGLISLLLMFVAAVVLFGTAWLLP